MILETENLTKSYKGVLAVNGVNMHIENGDIYGFVGENGAGKTTIIRLITGLSIPTKGTYKLFDKDYKKTDIIAERKKIASIVETPSLDKSMTALENLKYQCFIKGEKTDEAHLLSILKKVGLNPDNIKNKPVRNFSLGMRQRLGIAVCLIGNPEFVILDEPMNGLDPQGFIEIRNLIVDLNEKEGVTFLISSHILSELDKVCTKVGFISKGKLLEEISMEELKNKSRKSIEIISDKNEEIITELKKKFNVNDYNLAGDKLVIYDEININSVMSLLIEKSLNIISLSCNEDTIEGYYLHLLMGGNSNV